MSSAKKLRGQGWLFLLVLPLIVAGSCEKTTKPKDPNTPSSITMPLKVGNSWTYSVSETETDAKAAADTSTSVERVMGTAPLAGQIYFLLRTESTVAAPESTLLRQSGQQVFVIPTFGGDNPSDSVSVWMGRLLKRSFPWKMADFTVASGRVFSFAADTSGTFSGQSMVVSVAVSSDCLGRTTLQVPAGSFTDVYHGQLTILVEIRSGSTLVATSNTTMEFFVKDAVGVVKQDWVEERPDQSGGTMHSTRTNLLRSYYLVP